jgi:hypothetical protein
MGTPFETALPAQEFALKQAWQRRKTQSKWKAATTNIQRK